jgi:hypothetical protein
MAVDALRKTLHDMTDLSYTDIEVLDDGQIMDLVSKSVDEDMSHMRDLVSKMSQVKHEVEAASNRTFACIARNMLGIDCRGKDIHQVTQQIVTAIHSGSTQQDKDMVTRFLDVMECVEHTQQVQKQLSIIAA